MSSRRLPGKVLLDLGGQTMLAWVVNGVRAATKVESVVVLTTKDNVDLPIVDECIRLGVDSWCGSTDRDVLGDFRRVADEFGFDPIVRVTADCPLIDPVLIDKLIDTYNSGCDYCLNAPNVHDRTYPRGLDTEVFSYAVLKWMDDNLTRRKTPYGRYHPDYRKHVTFYMRENPHAFTIKIVKLELDRLRLVVDTRDEYECMRELFRQMGDSPSWWKACELVGKHPELGTLETPETQTKMKWRVW